MKLEEVQKLIKEAKKIADKKSKKHIEIELQVHNISDDFFNIFLHNQIFDENRTERHKIMSQIYVEKNTKYRIETEGSKVKKEKKIAIDNLKISNNFNLALSSEEKYDVKYEPKKFKEKSKDRISKYSDLFSDWRFDFTVIKFAKHNNIITHYSIEVEFIGEIDKILESDIHTIIKFITFANPKFAIPKILNLQSQSNNINDFLAKYKLLDLNEIGNNLAITDKADSERTMIYSDQMGNIILISKPFKLHLIGHYATDGMHENIFLLDCEYVFTDHPNRSLFLSLDVLINKGNNITNLKFEERNLANQNIVELISKNKQKNPRFSKKKLSKIVLTQKFKIRAKQYFIANNSNYSEISKQIWDNKNSKYNVVGLIFLQTDKSYYKMDAMEWKSHENLTINFLIRVISNNKEKKYSKGKKVELYIIISQKDFKKNKFKLSRDYHIKFPQISRKNKCIPYPFIPQSYTEIETKNIGLAKIDVKSVPSSLFLNDNVDIAVLDNDEIIPIVDNVIIEFYYGDGKWQPKKFKKEKTEEYLNSIANNDSRIKGPDGWRYAKNMWRNIKNPISEDKLFGKKK